MARPIARWLFRLSGRLPCRLIKIEGSPYLERYWLGRGMGVTAYLHRFVGRDGDRNLHDHPWRWSLSIVLTGGYLEARLRWFDPSLTTGWNERVRRIGGWRRLNWIGCGDFHQIVRVDPETWTLFMHGPRVKGWGFLSSGQNLDEHDPAYVSYDGYPPPASFDWQHASPIGREAGREPLGVR